MCRLVAYLGHEVLLEEVLVKPINSIVMQSLHARESDIRTNGDGFGLGWYAPSINDTPGLFRSVLPAWNDLNLLNLTEKIKSPCFFAHVRAASAGGVSQYNCHPFVHGRWMFMHNGEIFKFKLIKRHLRHLLDDDIYDWLKGETDSEHFFALFLQLSKGKNLNELSVVTQVLQNTFQQVDDLIKEFGEEGPCHYNICLTDGLRMIASRYCTDTKVLPETMHYSFDSNFLTQPSRFGRWPLIGRSRRAGFLIASEKLNDFDIEWHDVPVKHLIVVDSDLSVHLQSL